MEKKAKITIGFVVAAALGFMIYMNVMNWYKKGVDKALTVERNVWQEKTEGLEEKIAGLEKQMTATAEPAEPKEKVTEALGNTISDNLQNQKQLSFDAINAQVMAFFAYLDGQPYIAEKKLKGGSYQEYVQIVDLLSERPPVIVGETDSLHRLYKNMAHFFRVLGKTRLMLTRDVLTNELPIMESVMRTFYLWYTLEGESKEKVPGRPELKVSYTYASFFLETISGRSYLLRRSSKTRLLTTYYSVMFIDRANDNHLNSFGVDIRPHIKSLSQDIRNQMGLASRGIYLRELDRLARKYKMH